MGSPFFAGIKWDAIYERVNDGPWIPEVQVFGGAKSAKNTKRGSTATANGDADDNGHGEKDEYAGFDTNNNHRASTAGDNNAGNRQARKSSTDKSLAVDGIQKPTNRRGGDGSESESSSGDDSGEEDEDDDEDAGYLSNKDMRDSVFILSRGQLENKLADWSFIDEQVLRSTMEANNNGSSSSSGQGEESAEERRARRAERRAARALRTVAPVPEGDESDEEAAGTTAAAPTATAAPVTSNAAPVSAEEPSSQEQQPIEPAAETVAVDEAAMAPTAAEV